MLKFDFRINSVKEAEAFLSKLPKWLEQTNKFMYEGPRGEVANLKSKVASLQHSIERSGVREEQEVVAPDSNQDKVKKALGKKNSRIEEINNAAKVKQDFTMSGSGGTQKMTDPVKVDTTQNIRQDFPSGPVKGTGEEAPSKPTETVYEVKKDKNGKEYFLKDNKRISEKEYKEATD